jgi:sugar O-acyltransferase (sialic acid O-acetyltransferase NeuD family)
LSKYVGFSIEKDHIEVSKIKKIIILGTGGNSIDILDTINDLNVHAQQLMYQCVGFLDDNASLWEKELYGVKVIGPLTTASELSDCFFVNGIGNPQNFWKKETILTKTGVPLDRFATIIHPTASVSRTAKLGLGTVVFQNVTITSNVRVGNHVIILPNTVVSHDDVIGDYTCITGGVCISGEVKIGRSCYLGTGSVIRGGVEIGDYCLIGMGSVILKNVPDNSVVVGNPARYLRPVKEKT